MEENEMKIDPKCSVQVISNTSFFYPLNKSDGEGLIVFHTVNFLMENFNETIKTLTTNDKTVVFQLWNGILFYISSQKSFSEEILRFLLQIIRDIAIFLFGAHFETIMIQNIQQSLRETFAKYIEMFFFLCNNDYKYLLMVPSLAPECSGLMRFMNEHNPFNQVQMDPSFVECILFKSHRIAGRLSCKQTSNARIGPKDLFQIVLSERIEFANDVLCGNADNNVGMSEVSLSQIQSSAIKYKVGHLSFDGVPQQCFLALAQLGADSPFVCIFIYRSEQPNQELKDKIFHTMSQLILTLKDYFNSVKEYESPVKTIQITGLFHYLLINRTTGEYYESPKSSQNDQIFTQTQKKMASVSMSSLMSGNSIMMRNHMLFQYTYELIFRKKGNIIPLNKKLKIRGDDFSYQRIIEDQFHNDSAIQCYELMTCYLGVMNTKDVAEANKKLFDMLVS